ncbi:MAG TPA: glycosyltransferase [Gemmataceae bacterium]|jgi:glycosyltransferase involved in cell wall biosynthesis
MPELPRLPPIASQPLSAVLIARNSANHLEAVLGDWITFLNGLDREYELILVDDGSTDGGGDLAEKLATNFRRVRVLRHTTARGEGAALRTALTVAQHPLLFYTLCDPHYQPADLGKLLRKRSDPNKPDLELDQVHILSASRGGRPTPGPWRVLGLLWRIFCRVLFTQAPDRLAGWLGWKRHLARTLVRLLFGVRYHDVACPFRLHRRAIFSRIPVQSDGSFVHVEILAKANALGLMMGEEVPLEPGHYPPLKDTLAREEFRQLLADARRVIRHPDFGPPRLDAPSSEASTGGASASASGGR